MEFGHFSSNSREYIITRPDTPTPWINYISNPRGYCGIVSQTGGGFSFHRDPRERRITKYRYNNVPVDRPGRYFYIKDMETGEFWSPTWQPVMKDMDSYECRHGQGYTVISSAYQGMDHEILYFVPQGEDCEVWRLKIKNNSGKDKKLSVYSYSEFTFWSEPESRNIQWSLHLTRCSYDDGLILYNFIEPHPAFDMKANKNYVGDRSGYAFMGMNKEILDHDCARDAFIGMYRSETDPAGVRADRLSGSVIRGGVACAALRTHIELAHGAQDEVIVTLGFAENKKTAVRLRGKFGDDNAVESELRAVKDAWTTYLGTFHADTPDESVNTMVNVWNQYQCKTTFDWSRYISFYENGEGRGMGTRDSCQDTLAVASQMPERVRNRIFQILSTTQFTTGDCYHQFFPLGGRGDLKGFSDDHLWLIQMVYSYIAETGDLSILDKKVPYAGSEKKGTVYRHLAAALNYTGRMKGRHGLPLILTADWNDTLHLWMEAKKPESVLTAELYVFALRLMARLAERKKKKKDAAAFMLRAKKMAGIINKKCWDGNWYYRGFGSEIIGTNAGARAKIFLNSQAWAVISGTADDGRAKQCMDSVNKYLASDEGIKKVWPPFDGYDQTYGLISRYNIGRKENGIFAHANAWAIVAEAMLGRCDAAFKYYKNILPLKYNKKAEVLKTEPYIFCQAICSNDSITPGEGANSWLTGTASWMYVAATQYLLGIRPELDGLKISPCIPGAWDKFKVKRFFRGCEYNIIVRKTGRNRIEVNGAEIKGNIIKPVKGRAAEVMVEVL
jgi:cellobiose phosphorylase